jgi:hypothetical protein
MHFYARGQPPASPSIVRFDDLRANVPFASKSRSLCGVKALARNLLPSGVRDSNINARGNMAAEGFFIDWDGNARSTSDPGGGYLCEADTVARYVAIMTKSGALMHEGTYYKTLADIEKAGIKASLVPGSHPWGSKAEGF